MPALNHIVRAVSIPACVRVKVMGTLPAGATFARVNVGLAHVLPLSAAMIYVFGALLVKRATDFRVGVWRMAFVSNLTSATIFTLLWPLGGTLHVELWWQPASVAVIFILGQLLNFLALDRGDVSVATPVLGLKIVLVAFFTTVVLQQGVPAKLWMAAFLGSAGIALLNLSGKARHHHVAMTIVYSGTSAAMFALFDVFLQKWSPAWGPGRFLPVMLWMVAVFSVVLIPMFREPLSAIPRAGWPWLLGGCVLIGTQSMLFGLTIVEFGNATAANVIYSSRGLWSVVGVWLIGHWFKNQEQHLGARVLAWRFFGAALMVCAIVLVLV